MKLEPRIKRVFIFANSPQDMDFLNRSVRPYIADITLIGKKTGLGSFLLDGQNYASSDLVLTTSDFGLFGTDLRLFGTYLKIMGLEDLQVMKDAFYCIRHRNEKRKLKNDSCCNTNDVRFGCALYTFMKSRENFLMKNFYFVLDDKVEKNGVLVDNPDKVILLHNPDASSISREELNNGGLKEILF